MRLQEATTDLLRQFRAINPNIEYQFENPTDGSVSEVNERVEYLKNQGILPTNLRVMEQGERSEKLIYPYAILSYGTRQTAANLLEEQRLKVSEDEVLNKSVNLLEYKMADALSKLVKKERNTIAIMEGRGEMTADQTARLEKELSIYHDVARVHFDSILQLSQEVELVIVAKPTETYLERDLFKLDQYVMHGGKVIWLVDNFAISLDSIGRYGQYVPRKIVHGLDDMFFDYGVRIRSNLILDLECSKIPQVIGMSGDKPQTSLFDWYYHPLAQGNPDHPVSKNIGRINFVFPSTLETLKSKNAVKWTPLASTSNYSRYQQYPMQIGFDILKLEPDPSKFNKGPQQIAVLGEGTFKSHFTNRVSKENQDNLKNVGIEFKSESDVTKQIFVSDADFMKNLYDPNNNRISDIGYNKWEEKAYPGNRSLIINMIDFLLDDYGLLESRSKDVKLRLLDQAKIQEERSFWQFLNVGLPILLLLGFGLVYRYLRRRKYT